MDQSLLFIGQLAQKGVEKYRTLFSLFSPFNQWPVDHPRGGRNPTPKDALLNALILKNCKSLANLSDLHKNLIENPYLYAACGFDPLRPIPPVERFSSFLNNTPNTKLKVIMHKLVVALINAKIIKNQTLAIDSCPVPVLVKENNLKTNIKNRFDKRKIPKADPDCRLGVTVHFIKADKKEIVYFWGYRNHAILDTESELPFIERTAPANFSDKEMFIPLFSDLKEQMGILPENVTADSIYDSEDILLFVFKELLAQPYIPRNPRRKATPNLITTGSGIPLCIAGFKMKYWGITREKNRIRAKFVCPIHHSKKFRRQHPACPWNLKKFKTGKGCYRYIQVNTGIRNKLDYGSQTFKKTYCQRTSIERLFSRLFTFVMQRPSVRGSNAVANVCTIAHISVLLVAYTAFKLGYKDRIRYIKNLFPKF